MSKYQTKSLLKCCVVNCSTNYKNSKESKEEIHLYSFPQKKIERFEWIKSIQRIEPDGSVWMPNKYCRICSKHFVNGQKSEDPRSPSFNPTIFHDQSTEEKVTESSHRHNWEPLTRRNKHDEVNVICQELIEESIHQALENNFHEIIRIIVTTINETNEELCKANDSENDESENDESEIDESEIDESEIDESEIDESEIDESEIDESEIDESENDESENDVEIEENYITAVSTASGSSYRTPFFQGFDSFVNNMDSIYDLTSISPESFHLLLSLLPATNHKQDEIRKEDKLLLFLTKLKLGINFTALGILFSISDTTASRYFEDILHQLFDATENLIFWPSRNAIQSTMPKSFKHHYSNCRVVIHCIEVKTERPFTDEQQFCMYSSSKGAYTIKYLVGFAPSGLITFISNGYGGNSSISYIASDCGILNLLQKGDVVMADRGLIGIGTIVNADLSVVAMPPFSENARQFSEDMQEICSISRVRILVERAIQRLKIFNILNNEVPVDLIPLMDKILHVCSILTSFQPR